MAENVIVIGTGVSTLPFQLAGASIRTPALSDTTSTFLAALEAGPRLVLVAAEFAAQIPPGVLAQARCAARPMVLVLPDAQIDDLDVSRLARRALGLR